MTTLDAPIETVRTELFIDGRAEPTAEYLPIADPARPGVVVGESAAATARQAAAAVAAATAAFPAWSRMSPAERAERMLRASAIDAADVGEIARVLTLENGKILGESTGDVLALGGLFAQTTQVADAVDAQVRYAGPPSATTVGHIPMGVVTIILPFNWPLAILGASLPQALLAGNTVIVKPPRSAPLATVLAVARIASLLPSGVLNIVTGEDAVIGEPLIAGAGVAKVCFTGSVAAGRRIMAIAAGSLTRVALELGGNDPVLILRDAELGPAALDRLCGAVYASTGQICMAAKRLYVHRSRYDEVVTGLSERLAGVRIGHGLDQDTTMGPLHQRAQRDFVADLVAAAGAAGAEVREFGELPADPAMAGGNFTRPSLVLDPDPALGIVTEEQFGPSVPLLPFADESTVADQANDGWSGLGASVWSADEERARGLVARLRSGYGWVNAHGASFVDHRAPFGGLRGSGMGREFGIEGVREFMDLQSVSTVPPAA